MRLAVMLALLASACTEPVTVASAPQQAAPQQAAPQQATPIVDVDTGPRPFDHTCGVGGFHGRGAPVAHVAIREIHDVTGAIAREDVRRLARRHVNEIRTCYEAELARQPELVAWIEARVAIHPDGSVASVGMSASVPRVRTLKHCMRASISTWTFQAPANNHHAHMTVPFRLDTDDDE